MNKKEQVYLTEEEKLEIYKQSDLWFNTIYYNKFGRFMDQNFKNETLQNWFIHQSYIENRTPNYLFISFRNFLFREMANRSKYSEKMINVNEDYLLDGENYQEEFDIKEHVDPRLQIAVNYRQSLSSEEKFIFSLYYLDGYTIRQICEILGGRSNNYVSLRLKRFRTEINEIYKNEQLKNNEE